MAENVLLRSLADVVRGHHPTQQKIPWTRRVPGRALLQRLALGGTPWADVRVETLPSLATQMASQEILRHGQTVADPTMTFLLVADLLDEVPEARAYVQRTGATPGVIRAVHRTLTQVRLHRPTVPVDPGAFTRSCLDPA